MVTVKQATKALIDADKRVTHSMASVRDNPAMKVVAFLAEGADQPPLIAVCVGTVAIGVIGKRPDLVRGGARMLSAHLLTTAAKAAIKHQIDRTRPKKALHDGYQLKPGHTDEHELNSFPSGHTAGAVAVARAASRDIDGVALPGALATIAVAATQAPAGNHYLSDVIAGAAIGWVVEAMVSAVFDRIEPSIERALTA